jgi:hypothetical protein
VQFSDDLYENDAFLSSLANALKSDGVLAAQIGSAGFIVDPVPREYTRTSVLDNIFIPRLAENGFAKFKTFTEAYGGFWENWNFLVAYKDARGNTKWYRNEALTEIEIRKRIAPSVVYGDSLLRFFDGALMKSYSYPPRNDEKIFCHKRPTPPYCDIGLEIDSPSSLTATPTNGFVLLPSKRRLVQMMNENTAGSTKWQAFENYLRTFGSETRFYGDVGYFLSTRAESTFGSGPGCLDGEECNVTGVDNVDKLHGYNPFFDRNHLNFITHGVEGLDQAGE